MDDAGEGLRATRRQVLGATAGALAVGALLGRSSAQQASGPTVYVGSYSTLYAVDAATGEQEWAFTQPSDNVYSSPTVADGTVYVGSGDNTLYAVDAATGEQTWAFTQPSNGVRSSPTVADCTVYVGSNEADGENTSSTLYAVDAATGTQQWAFTQPSSVVRSSPTVADGTVYVGSNDNTLYAVDTATGTQQWAFTQPSGAVISSPTVADGTVYVGSLDKNLYAVDASTGSQEWALTQPPGPVWSSPTVADGTVYVGSWDRGSDSGALYAVDAATGTQEWAFTQPSDDVYSSPTVVADPESGDSVGSRVMLGTLGHHGERADRVTTVDPDDASGDDGGASGDDSESPDDGGPSDGGDTSDDSADSDSSGDGGLGTTEMAAIGGGGTLALLFGAYALMRRADDDGDDTTPERSSEPDTPGRGATAPTESQSSDSNPGDTVDDLLDDVTQTLDSARQSADAGEYDRALARCERTIGTAKEAREDAPGHVPDAESALNDAAALREAIQTERDAREQATDALDTAEGALDDAAGALDSGSLDDAFDSFDDARAALADAGDAIPDHEFPALADRLAALEQRHGHLRQGAEDAITRTPTTIPTTPRYSLTYDDIEKGDPLGSGGNADVYHATTRADGEQVALALKEPRMGGTLHIETVERMMQEAETWQKLDDHDHIVSVVDYDSEPLPWIAMEYMNGSHLGERTAEFDFDQALWTAVATTKAVRHAHRRGVAHLDLKPENILFRRVADAWDAPKVADWGLSKHLLDHSKSVEGMTVEYAAPEQFDDEYGAVDDITDVYQLGAVFYKLFTGRPPFEGKPFKLMNRIQNEEPEPPSAVAGVPAELDEILLRAMATEKKDRYEDVLLLRNDLQTLSEELAGGF